MNSNIGVSILCITYNHEKYIRKALESFIKQKTNFKFEVLVHDDASTDSTASIVMEYAEKYPDIIKPICQKENQHSKGIKIFNQILSPLAQGKYVSICEGDDYMTDENKLQKQFDILESHPECSACFHQVSCVAEDGTPLGTYFPKNEVNEGVIQSEDFIRLVTSGYYFQTSSYFFRREDYVKYATDPHEFKRVGTTGDRLMMLWFGQNSSVYYFNDVMSSYRRGAINSFSQRYSRSPERRIKHLKNSRRMYELYNVFTNYKYEKHIKNAIIKNEFALAIAECDYKKILSKEYKELFNELPARTKVKYRIGKMMPGILKKYID